MVQVIDLLSPGAEFGKGLGQGLGAGAQRLFEMGMTERGLGRAEQSAREAGGDPISLAFAMARAGSYSPYLERAIGPIYQELMKRSKSGDVAAALSGVADQEPMMVVGQPREQGIPAGPTEQEESFKRVGQTVTPKEGVKVKDRPTEVVSSLSADYLAQTRPDLVQGTSQYGQVPSFKGVFQSDLTADEEGRIRQDLRNRGVHPDAVEQVVDRLRQDVKTRSSDQLQNYNLGKEQLDALGQKWETFREQSNSLLNPFISKYSVDDQPLMGTQSELRNKYYQYAQDQPVNLTPEQMHANAMTLLQNDMNQIDRLASQPSLPIVRGVTDVDKFIKDYRVASKDLRDRGFIEAIKEDATANKDMGMEEVHAALYGDETDKSILNRIAAIKVPELAYRKLPAADWRKDQKKKYVNSLSEILKNIDGNDDLILMRAQVLNNGGSIDVFKEALEKAQEEGLELSPLQKSHMVDVMKPRVSPLWEIFNPSAWSSWVNGMRGKK